MSRLRPIVNNDLGAFQDLGIQLLFALGVSANGVDMGSRLDPLLFNDWFPHRGCGRDDVLPARLLDRTDPDIDLLLSHSFNDRRGRLGINVKYNDIFYLAHLDRGRDLIHRLHSGSHHSHR